MSNLEADQMRNLVREHYATVSTQGSACAPGRSARTLLSSSIPVACSRTAAATPLPKRWGGFTAATRRW